MRIFVALLLFCSTLSFAKKSETVAPRKFEFGALSAIFLPNDLPEFYERFTSYGARAGLGLGGHTLQAIFLYGFSGETQSYVGELSYRLNLDTPFFSGFFSGGAFLLQYNGQTISPTRLGPAFGTGFGFSATQGFDVLLEMRLLFAQRPMAAFSASVIYVLR